MTESLRLPGVPESLRRVRAFLGERLDVEGVGSPLRDDLVLAVDEACQNIVRHGYKGQGGGDLVVSVGREGARLVIELTDWAPPVDPACLNPRDINEVRPGGLGLHFINALMDRVCYLPPPPGAGNLLRLEKNLNEETP